MLDTRQRTYGCEDQEATRFARITHEGLAVLQAADTASVPRAIALRTTPQTDQRGTQVPFPAPFSRHTIGPVGYVIRED